MNTTGWQAFFPKDARAVWAARIHGALEPGEQLLTWALTPDMPGDGLPTTAVALTPCCVLALGAGGPARSWSLDVVATVELRSSPVASTFLVWTDRPAAELVIPFPFSLSPAFLDLFLALRQRLTAFPGLTGKRPEALASPVRRKA